MITEIDFFRPLESVDSLLIAMRRAVTPTAYRALQVSLAQELSNAIEQYRGAYDIWQQSLPLNVTAQELKDWRKKFNGIDEWSLHFQEHKYDEYTSEADHLDHLFPPENDPSKSAEENIIMRMFRLMKTYMQVDEALYEGICKGTNMSQGAFIHARLYKKTEDLAQIRESLYKVSFDKVVSSLFSELNLQLSRLIQSVSEPLPEALDDVQYTFDNLYYEYHESNSDDIGVPCEEDKRDYSELIAAKDAVYAKIVSAGYAKVWNDLFDQDKYDIQPNNFAWGEFLFDNLANFKNPDGSLNVDIMILQNEWLQVNWDIYSYLEDHDDNHNVFQVERSAIENECDVETQVVSYQEDTDDIQWSVMDEIFNSSKTIINIVRAMANECKKPAHYACMMAVLDDYHLIKDRYAYEAMAAALGQIGHKVLGNSIGPKMRQLTVDFHSWNNHKFRKDKEKCFSLESYVLNFPGVTYRYPQK